MCRTSQAMSKKKTPFHMEKLRSFAFKTLMHAFRTSYHEIVPEYALKNLEAEHLELLQFIKKVYIYLPKIKTTKSGKSASSDASVQRKAKIYDLFGFYSFNKEFRKRVFSDPLFAAPLMILLDHYNQFRSKFKEHFVKIFEEFRNFCNREHEEFHSQEDILRIEREFFHENTLDEKKELSEIHVQAKDNAVDKKNIGLQIAKLHQFIELYPIEKSALETAVGYLYSEDLFNVFMTLVKNVESPLTVPTLQNCFEFYLVLLRIKHQKDCGSQTGEKRAIFRIRTDAKNSSDNESGFEFSSFAPESIETWTNTDKSNDCNQFPADEFLLPNNAITVEDDFQNNQFTMQAAFKFSPTSSTTCKESPFSGDDLLAFDFSPAENGMQVNENPLGIESFSPSYNGFMEVSSSFKEFPIKSENGMEAFGVYDPEAFEFSPDF
eukprot:CAMPEP_0114998394 /NCGR_PEP_ID=MMETSP0216-20121206/15481_1 /TAXON_ID=223996 /ORGANISM="Protocruzia adherens, Strain Boccale" /LENGTH=434 /DNA_ID=CAMNT_0002362983 /DNA_START=683 /DNA_END=1987 /DNA_ORIENTATION=-